MTAIGLFSATRMGRPWFRLPVSAPGALDLQAWVGSRAWSGFNGRAGLALASGLLFALLQPFGFLETEPVSRFGFWCAVLVLWLVGFAACKLGLMSARPFRRLPGSARFAIAALLAALPVALLANFIATGQYYCDGPSEMAERVMQVLVIAMPFEFASHAIQRRAGTTADRLEGGRPFHDPTSNAGRPPSIPSTHEAADDRDTPALARRLPFDRRGDILCLQMEDHYVRVHTPRGSTLLLMRFSDALAELGDTRGLRIHRSWWIATDALDALHRSGRSIRVRLANGLTAPVSRPYAQAVEELAAISSGRLAPARRLRDGRTSREPDEP